MTLSQFLDSCLAEATDVRKRDGWIPICGPRTAALLVVVYVAYGHSAARRVSHASGFGNCYTVCIGAAMIEKRAETLARIAEAVEAVRSIDVCGNSAAKENHEC